MQVKVFESTDMAAGLKMVRRELGPDALILSTRTLKNGKLGLLGKPVLEITAAIDAPWPQQGRDNFSPPRQEMANPGGHLAYKKQMEAPRVNSFADSRLDDTLSYDSLYKEVSKTKAPPLQARESRPDTAPQMNEEFNELKEMVQHLAQEIAQLDAQKNTKLRQQLEEHRNQNDAATAAATSETKALTSAFDLLTQHGVNADTAKIISEYARECLSDAELTTPATLHTFLQKAIADLLQISGPLFTTHDKAQQRIALVGPTGVGKTTTLAKIAAGYLSHHSPSIALITVDTYRIAAVEQLKVYGELMRLPVEVVITPEQLQRAIDRHQDKELILIDTAGRSPKDHLSIDDIDTFFPPELSIDKHLVLSATTRDEELYETVRKFDKLKIDHTILTKIDECSHLGVILNLQIQNKTPISYIAHGQRVPEDIFIAEKMKIAELILPQSEGNVT